MAARPSRRCSGKDTAITEIQPTVFFRRTADALEQAVNISIRNNGGCVKAVLHVRIGDKNVRIHLGNLKKGDNAHTVYLPDVRRRTAATFTLLIGGREVDSIRIRWQPTRHWRLYLVHNSHHDLGYTDLPSNVLKEHRRFIHQALQLCRQTRNFPPESQFRYTVEASWSLIDFMEKHPSQINELIKWIKAGRIELTALYANEVTELCSHEELIRLLYPSFRLKREYGIAITSAELNDIPGLSWGLVPVLAGAGVRYFSAGVPDYFALEVKKDDRWTCSGIHFVWDESEVIDRELPGGFRWRGQNGKELLFWYARFGCGGLPVWTCEQLEHQLPGELQLVADKGYPFDIIRYQLKSGERDNSPPAIRFSHVVRQWNRKWAFPKLILSTNDLFFRELERHHYDRLPVITGSLPDTDYIIGSLCLAKETAVNRRNHDAILSAEKWAAVAAELTDYVYPGAEIEQVYKDILLYDAHCWGIGHTYGPAQDASKSEKSVFAYHGQALAHDISCKSLNKIADAVKLPKEGDYIIVFNPLSWSRTDVARTPLVQPRPCGRPLQWKDGKLVPAWVLGRDVVDFPRWAVEEPFALIDTDTGKPVPYQITQQFDNCCAAPWAGERSALGMRNDLHLKELTFVAGNVPSLGCKVYRLTPCDGPADFPTTITVSGSTIENRFYKITFDERTGAVRRIYDKQLKKQIIDPNAPHHFNQIVVRCSRTGRQYTSSSTRLENVEAGPVHASLVVSASITGCPKVTQELRLYSHLKRIDIFNRILRDASPLLEVYLAFPFAVRNPRISFEGTGTVLRPGKDQFPGSNCNYYAVQHWAELYNDDIGIVFSCLDAPVLEFGGLWPNMLSQAHHSATPPAFGEGFVTPPFRKGHLYSFIMNNNARTNFQNVQVSDALFRYAFTSRRGGRKSTRAHQFGWAASTPLDVVFAKGPQHGTFSGGTSFCRVRPGNVEILTFKQAEDKDGLILRLIETRGRRADARVSIPFVEISDACQTDLVENDKEKLPADRHEVTVPVAAFDIATVRIRLRGRIIRSACCETSI